MVILSIARDGGHLRPYLKGHLRPYLKRVSCAPTPGVTFAPTSMKRLYLNFPSPALHPTMLSMKLLYLNFPPLRSTQQCSPCSFFI